MKNKKTAYYLVPIVLGIWGMIGWKVYAVMKGRGKEVEMKISERKNSVPIEIPDTISLVANYRDPFLDKVLEVVHLKNSESNIQVENKPELPKAELKFPVVAYHGLIKKSGSLRTLGFLSIGGKSCFVKGGDDAEGVKVISMWKDSIEVSFNGMKKVVWK